MTRDFLVWMICLLFVTNCATGSGPRPVQEGTRTYGATAAILGAIGAKTPLPNGVAIFDRLTIPDWSSLEIYNAGTVSRDEHYVRELKRLGITAQAIAALNATADTRSDQPPKKSETPKVSADTSLKSDKQRRYRVVVLQIKDSLKVADELLRLIVTKPSLAAILRTPDMRLVTSVEAVFGHEATSLLASEGNAALSNLGGTTVQISLGVNRQTKLTLSDGMIIAYQYARLCWNKDGTALQLRLDVENAPGCPAGLTEILNALPNTKDCPSINGNWVRDLDGAQLSVVQTTCSFTAEAPRGDISHMFAGRFADGKFQYTIHRTNKLTACQTVMTGYIDNLTDTTMVLNVIGTDGRCELPADFHESLTWRRE